MQTYIKFRILVFSGDRKTMIREKLEEVEQKYINFTENRKLIELRAINGFQDKVL